MKNYQLYNEVAIPQIGFGTWQIEDGKETKASVLAALEAGYRHIDTAAAYGNEKSVGEAIRESGISREKLFITTKLWNKDRGYDSAMKACEKSLKKLGLEYIDLYLIHWPARDSAGEVINQDTWRAFERMYHEGVLRSIGVSNFKKHHLESVIETAELVPMVNQIEFHPGFMQCETIAFCRNNNILVEAWSPLGSGKVLKNEQLQEIAGHYGKSVAQLCVRWCLQHEVLPLPKSITPERIRENLEIFDFEITQEDMDIIDRMPYIGGSGLDPDKVNF